MDKENHDLKYWLCLGKNVRIGVSRFSEILSKKVSMKDIYFGSEEYLKGLGLSAKTVNEIKFCQENYDPDKVADELRKREIKAVTILDDNYPSMLKEIFDPPAILYYKGQPIDNDDLTIAVVGSRRFTDYGASTTTDIVTGLVGSGITIVSGMAIGIDTIAHQATLDAGGKTIAVLGCGLDQIYPSRNVQLAKEIMVKGTIISEFPIGVQPFRYNFPLRNRIISGLSKGLIVTEAAERSGSLGTANSALDQNREVFAVPGSIYGVNSKGPLNLIRMGAKLITSASDVLDELGIINNPTPKSLPEASNETEKAIINLLAREPKHIDAIIKESRITQTKITSVLTMMEISGKIKHIGGMTYRIGNS